MNFQNLEYFLTAANEGNITKAAETLHVSQQALSNQISRLEQELGCRLFDRGQGLSLTYAGQQFRQSAEKILDIHRQTKTELEDISNNRKGELRIGISYTRGQAILPLLLPKFSRKYPQVELHVTEGSTKVLEEELSKGRIDVLIGFAPFMIECAEYRQLMTEHLYLVIPKSLYNNSMVESYNRTRDMAVFKDIPFVLLREGDRIRTIMDREFYRCGISPHIRIETQNIQTAFALCSEGMGITVCPEIYLQNPYVIPGFENSKERSNVETVPLLTKQTQDGIAIAYNRERYLSKIASDFIDMTVEEFSS